MEIEIIDAPYNDRCCGNCAHCAKASLNYCLQNHVFVASKKWCSDWEPENRKFEK